MNYEFIHSENLNDPRLEAILKARDTCDYQCFLLAKSILPSLLHIAKSSEDIDQEAINNLEEVIKRREKLSDLFSQLISGRIPQNLDQQLSNILNDE